MSLEKQPSRDERRGRVPELEEYYKDGSTIWTESIFNAIRNNQGEVIGLLSITRGITGRRNRWNG